MKLNPDWEIPNDGTAARNPTIKLSFDVLKLTTPLRQAELELAHFTDIPLTGGESSIPTDIIVYTGFED